LWIHLGVLGESEVRVSSCPILLNESQTNGGRHEGRGGEVLQVWLIFVSISIPLDDSKAFPVGSKKRDPIEASVGVASLVGISPEAQLSEVQKAGCVACFPCLAHANYDGKDPDVLLAGSKALKFWFR
jgi:hypothetical protein